MAKESKSIAKKIKGENEPKKPTTEYFMFLKDERKNLQQGLNVKEQTQILSKMWAEIDPERKKKYSEDYQVALGKYKEEIAEYKQTEEYQIVQQQNKDLKIKMQKKAARPKVVRKPSGYNLFVKEERQRMTKEKEDLGGFKEISQIISKKWRELSEEQKEEYKEQAKELGDDKQATENVEPQE